MSRLIFILAVVAAVYLLIRSFRRNMSGRDESEANLAAQDMVRCAQCGVYVPKSESIQAEGKFFCCAAHRDAFKQ